MNFFKKALVATAVVASFGASAATVSSTALQLSAEGIADGLSADDQTLVFDVVVGVDTPASSTITLTFDNTIDLAGVLTGPVLNDPNTGVGTVGVANDANAVQFDYGTGSFTFDNVVVTNNDQSLGEQDTLSFEVNLGNALTAGSAFRITLGDTTLLGNGGNGGEVDITGAANLAYQSVAASGSVIENGAGVVAEETAQFAFSVSSPYAKLIDRTIRDEFTDGGVATETAVLSYTNNGNNLAAALVDPAVSIVIDGNWDGLVTTADFAVLTAAATGADAIDTVLTGLAGFGDTSAAVNSDDDSDELTITLAAVNTSLGGATVISLPFKNITDVAIPVTGDLKATATIIAANGSTDPIVVAANVAAGEWKIDATIINVPYFPVGYTGVQSTVILANEGATATDVIITAIDQNGTEYGPVNLNTATAFSSDLPAKTVSKVSDVLLMDLLGAPASTKLSVTFNIDANEGVVNGYAYTQKDGTGRSEVSTSQQHGK